MVHMDSARMHKVDCVAFRQVTVSEFRVQGLWDGVLGFRLSLGLLACGPGRPWHRLPWGLLINH